LRDDFSGSAEEAGFLLIFLSFPDKCFCEKGETSAAC